MKVDDRFIRLFARSLGWKRISIHRDSDSAPRYSMQYEFRYSPLALMFFLQEQSMRDEYNFSACVYCRRFACCSGFFRINLSCRETDIEDESCLVSEFLHRSNFRSRHAAFRYKTRFPLSVAIYERWVDRKKRGPAVPYIKVIGGKPVYEVYDVEMDLWRDQQIGDEIPRKKTQFFLRNCSDGW